MPFIWARGGAWLGSLELLEDNVRVGGLLQWLEGGLKGLVERVSITNVESGKMKLPSSYDVIVMNPPFTRATGRVSEEFEEGRKALFGFIADEDVRKKVKERYYRLREIIGKIL
ncbi:MAG: hypothetical protein ABIM42_05905 [candidate division WOR-3 bacterium]